MQTLATASIRRSDAIGLLDIGTSKTICLIIPPPGAHGSGLWRRDGAGVMGCGVAATRGLKAGVVIDMEGAEQALRAAVTQAELAAGVTLNQVLVAVTGGRLKSLSFEAEARVADGIVTDADVDRLEDAGRDYAQHDGHTLLHLAQIGYRLDDAGGVSNPRGMAGDLLAADFHAVTAEEGPLRNLLHVVERAFLVPTGLVPAPHASGLAATSDEERRAGVTCIDMGAGTTTLSMFAEGHLLAVDTVAVGGHHVTFDIARSLAAPIMEAERIKTLHASVEEGAAEDDELISFAASGAITGESERGLNETTKADLHEIVAPRITDLLTQAAERIERSGVAHLAAHRIVLTGGSSQLKGLGQFAEDLLGQPVRVGHPELADGVPVAYCNPIFSTAIGLIPIALDPAARLTGRSARGERESAGYLARVSQWLRHGF